RRYLHYPSSCVQNALRSQQKRARAEIWKLALATPAMEGLPPTTLSHAPRALPKRSAVQEKADEDSGDPKPVVAFLSEHMPVARGSKADWAEIWQAKLGQEAWSATQFGAVLRHICEQANRLTSV